MCYTSSLCKTCKFPGSASWRRVASLPCDGHAKRLHTAIYDRPHNHVEQQTMFYVFTGDPPSNQLANARIHSIFIKRTRTTTAMQVNATDSTWARSQMTSTFTRLPPYTNWGCGKAFIIIIISYVQRIAGHGHPGNLASVENHACGGTRFFGLLLSDCGKRAG